MSRGIFMGIGRNSSLYLPCYQGIGRVTETSSLLTATTANTLTSNGYKQKEVA